MDRPLKRYAVIPARGNSKGIHKKNLHQVSGKPLLYYTIKAALDSAIFDDVVVSSESEEVLSYASEAGAIVNRRPEQLSSDDIHAVFVVLDYIESANLPGDSLVSMLLPTSPLRRALHIQEAFRDFENSDADSLVSVCEENKHILNFRRINTSGYLEQVFEGDPNVQRQELDTLYTVNGSIYISTVQSLLKHKSFHLGKVIPFVMDSQFSIDVNTLKDIAEAERRIYIAASDTK